MEACSRCGEQAAPGRASCERHMIADRKKSTRYKESPRGRQIRDAYSDAQRACNRKWSKTDKGKIGRNARGAALIARRKEIVNSLKRRPCSDCGIEFDPICMDFDHRPGEVKLFNVSESLRYSWKKIEAEIAKCDVVCACCHRIRTYRHRDHAALIRSKRTVLP